MDPGSEDPAPPANHRRTATDMARHFKHNQGTCRHCSYLFFEVTRSRLSQTTCLS